MQSQVCFSLQDITLGSRGMHLNSETKGFKEKTFFSLKSSVHYSTGTLLQAENTNNADHVGGGEFQASPQILDVAVPKAEENVTMVCHHKT